MSYIEIEIIQWGKHQPRKDIKHPTWFAVNNRIMEDPKLFGLSADEWKALFYIFSQASQQNASKVKIYFAHASGVCQIASETIHSAVAKLLEVGVVTTSLPRTRAPRQQSTRVRKRTDRVHDTTLQDTTLQNTTPHDMVPAPALPSPSPVGVYVSAYKEKYGFRPEVGPREGKILKTFSENHPGRWEDLIRGYLQMPDSWAVARSHPVEVLVAKVNEVGRFLATGKVVTRKVIEHAEEVIDKAQGTLRKPRKSIEELEAERAAMLADAAGTRALPGGEL